MWLRTAWSEVGGTQGHVQVHHARGADVAVMFWSDEAEAKADRTVVAEYLAGEASDFAAFAAQAVRRARANVRADPTNDAA